MLDIDFKVETPQGFAEIAIQNDSTDLGIAIWDNEEMIKPTVPEMRFSKLDSIRLAESILEHYEHGGYAPTQNGQSEQELNTTETNHFRDISFTLKGNKIQYIVYCESERSDLEFSLSEMTSYELATALLKACYPKESEAIQEKETTTELNTPSHYDNSNGSLYHFAELFDLDAYQFDIIKRIVRCKKKGNFSEDLRKTIDVLKLYELEQGKNNQ
jgi:hypothetical protein